MTTTDGPEVRHDVLAELVRFVAEDAPSPNSDSAILLALIGGAVTVMVALIGLVGTRMIARSAKPPDPSPGIDHEDHEAALERFLMRQGFDPNKIATGDEWPHDVRFF